MSQTPDIDNISKVCLDKLYLSDEAATPAYTEIPLAAMTPKLTKTSRPSTTNANVDANNTLWTSSQNTAVTEGFDVKTERFHDAAATPALLTALETIRAAAKKSSPDDYLIFKVVPSGQTAYLQTFSVDTCKSFGGDADGEAEFTFTLTSQGAPSAVA